MIFLKGLQKYGHMQVPYFLKKEINEKIRFQSAHLVKF